MKFIAIVPDCLNKFTFKYLDKQIKFPFSLTFFFSCLQRVKERKNHETLHWEGEQTIKVILMFYNFF